MPLREANPRNSQETAHLARESILDVITFIGHACQNVQILPTRRIWLIRVSNSEANHVLIFLQIDPIIWSNAHWTSFVLERLTNETSEATACPLVVDNSIIPEDTCLYRRLLSLKSKQSISPRTSAFGSGRTGSRSREQVWRTARLWAEYDCQGLKGV